MICISAMDPKQCPLTKTNNGVFWAQEVAILFRIIYLTLKEAACFEIFKSIYSYIHTHTHKVRAD